MPAWIAGHINAFQFIGGVPKTVIPDNLKNDDTNAICYEPGLNKNYAEMTDYYGTVILPARVRKPRDRFHVVRQFMWDFSRSRIALAQSSKTRRHVDTGRS